MIKGGKVLWTNICLRQKSCYIYEMLSGQSFAMDRLDEDTGLI